MNSRKLLLSITVLFSALTANFASAGNDTVFFNAQNSVYSKKNIEVLSVSTLEEVYPGQSHEAFKPVSLQVEGNVDGELSLLHTHGIAYQVEGEGHYTYMLLGRYGYTLYAFRNLNDLNIGNPYVEIGNVDASGYVIFYPDYDLDIALVEYNPTIMDKIMSWIISLGGRVTQADKWLEFKVIEKK